jgi:hypothetical protein
MMLPHTSQAYLIDHSECHSKYSIDETCCIAIAHLDDAYDIVEMFDGKHRALAIMQNGLPTNLI